MIVVRDVISAGHILIGGRGRMANRISEFAVSM